MNISPTLLLLMLVSFVFAPSIQEWVTQGGTSWYRPYQLWLLAIVFVWWSVRRSEQRQQKKLDQKLNPDQNRDQDNHRDEF